MPKVNNDDCNFDQPADLVTEYEAGVRAVADALRNWETPEDRYGDAARIACEALWSLGWRPAHSDGKVS